MQKQYIQTKNGAKQIKINAALKPYTFSSLKLTGNILQTASIMYKIRNGK